MGKKSKGKKSGGGGEVVVAVETKQMMAAADKVQFVSFMKRVIDEHNEMMKQDKKCAQHDWLAKYRRYNNTTKEWGDSLDKKAIIAHTVEIFREERSKNPEQRVPSDMTNLGGPFGKATAASMVEREIQKLKNKKDGSAPIGSKEVLRVKHANLPEERKEFIKKRKRQQDRKNYVLKKIGDEVPLLLPGVGDLELFDDGCYALIEQAARECGELNYILQRGGDPTLLQRMKLPTLSASEVAKFGKFTQFQCFLIIIITNEIDTLQTLHSWTVVRYQCMHK